MRLRNAIAFFVGHNAQPIIVQGENEIIIGRSAPGAPPPTVDLAAHKGYQHGVSRRHAMITRTDEGCTITDLESVNGVRLNNECLAANDTRPLENGDKIQVGELILWVYF